MSKPVLTKEIAYKAFQDFFSDKPFVLFATGTSCAVEQGFSMGELEADLKEKIPKCNSLNNEQKEEWQTVVHSLESNHDFEAAMGAVKDAQLLELIIKKTAEHVAKVDQRNSLGILNGTKYWTAISIFQRLVDGLPEVDPILHVATPNYDLLAEYAFTRAKILYSTGFCGGLIRKLDWTQAKRQMTYLETVSSGRKMQSITRTKKHICLYKVHGSLNTFRVNEGHIESDAWLWKCPEQYKRVMVTPGISKHQSLNENRDALLVECDKAIKKHHSFLFLGFGFNDSHLINNAIGEKLRQASPALIITRDHNDKIQTLLDNSDNAWLVCKHQDESNNSTRIFNRKYCNWLYLSDKELWCFDKFATEIMGN